jgi:hypothetical protein
MVRASIISRIFVPRPSRRLLPAACLPSQHLSAQPQGTDAHAAWGVGGVGWGGGRWASSAPCRRLPTSLRPTGPTHPANYRQRTRTLPSALSRVWRRGRRRGWVILGATRRERRRQTRMRTRRLRRNLKVCARAHTHAHNHTHSYDHDHARTRTHTRARTHTQRQSHMHTHGHACHALRASATVDCLTRPLHAQRRRTRHAASGAVCGEVT